MARVRRIIDEGAAYYERLLEERGVELVRAPARFVAPDALEADDLRITFAHALVATGSRPARAHGSGRRPGSDRDERRPDARHRAAGSSRLRRRRRRLARVRPGLPATGRRGDDRPAGRAPRPRRGRGAGRPPEGVPRGGGRSRPHELVRRVPGARRRPARRRSAPAARASSATRSCWRSADNPSSTGSGSTRPGSRTPRTASSSTATCGRPCRTSSPSATSSAG